MVESGTSNAFEITRSGTYAPLKRELDSFDKVSSSSPSHLLTFLFLHSIDYCIFSHIWNLNFGEIRLSHYMGPNPTYLHNITSIN